MNATFPPGGLAVVIGASGGIGAALLTQLQGDTTFTRVLSLSRQSQPALDLLEEASISAAARLRITAPPPCHPRPSAAY